MMRALLFFWKNLLILGCLVLFCTGCAFVNHEVDHFDGEVYMTAAPKNIPEERLLPFRVSDCHVRILEMIPLYSYSVDKCLEAVNPRRYPVYELRFRETFEAWELIVLACQALIGMPDSRTVCVEGVIVLPEKDANWTYRPAAPLFGPTIHELPESARNF